MSRASSSSAATTDSTTTKNLDEKALDAGAALRPKDDQAQVTNPQQQHQQRSEDEQEAPPPATDKDESIASELVSPPSQSPSQSQDVDVEKGVLAKELEGGVLPPPAAGGQTAGNAEGRDPNLVEWEPNDPDNPRNWPTGRKIFITFQLSMLALVASLGSSIIAPAKNVIVEYVGVSAEVGVLSVSLYIVGFACGPLLWAPISEIWGRRISLLPATFCLGLFSIGTALSKNAASIFLTRFFGGVFGSAPVSNVSASLGDIWHQRTRGIAGAFYSMTVVGGPTIGPIIGASLTYSRMGWRWTEYIEAIFVFAVLAMCYFFLPELYGPVLLKRKAERLRRETGNQDLYHPHEHIKLDFKSIVTKQLGRPLRMLFTEPMVTTIALYASFVYALLYLTLEVFPIIYEEVRQWTPVQASLPFLGLFVGVLFAMIVVLYAQVYYRRVSDAAGGRPVPEARLPPMAIGAFLFAIGLWWFGWTASPPTPWRIPTVATIFVGAGFNIIFGQCINFLVDTYGKYSASATAANTFLRSLLASSFPLVAGPMFHNLGVAPAVSILAGVATVAVPIPFLFMRYSVALRRMSRFAPFEPVPRA